jgi:hypothetical protein
MSSKALAQLVGAFLLSDKKDKKFWAKKYEQKNLEVSLCGFQPKTVTALMGRCPLFCPVWGNVWGLGDYR